MAYPTAEKIVVEAHGVSVALGVAAVEHLADFGGQAAGEPFVGVDLKYPGMRRLRDGPILEIGMIDKLPLDQPATAQAANEVRRVVGRERIGHENLVGHLTDRFDALADIVRFVAAGN